MVRGLKSEEVDLPLLWGLRAVPAGGPLSKSKVGNAFRGLCRDIRPVRHVDIGPSSIFI